MRSELFGWFIYTAGYEDTIIPKMVLSKSYGQDWDIKVIPLGQNTTIRSEYSHNYVGILRPKRKKQRNGYEWGEKEGLVGIYLLILFIT